MSRFDMGVLAKLDIMDALGAAQSFPTREDFWVALTKVHADAGRYLRGHTASVVIYDPENRNHFYKEMEEIRPILLSLRVKHIASIFNTLNDAITRMDVNSLNDGLGVFFADMDILRKGIGEAIVRNEGIDVRQSKPIIMVVDDMPEMLEVIVDILMGQYRVLALNSGHAALKALETQTPELFLFDIMIPGISGYQLAEKVRGIERFQDTPIIFMTDMQSEKHALAAQKISGNDYLKKPLNAPLLLETVQKHLHSE